MEKYRFDYAYNSVYEYSDDNNCYVYVAAINGRSEDQIISDLNGEY